MTGIASRAITPWQNEMVRQHPEVRTCLRLTDIFDSDWLWSQVYVNRHERTRLQVLGCGYQLQGATRHSINDKLPSSLTELNRKDVWRHTGGPLAQHWHLCELSC